MTGMTDRSMNEQDEQAARERLIRQMLAANTPETVRAAQAAADAWLREHPDDWTVLTAGEQLAMMASALGLPDDRSLRFI